MESASNLDSGPSQGSLSFGEPSESGTDAEGSTNSFVSDNDDDDDDDSTACASTRTLGSSETSASDGRRGHDTAKSCSASSAGEDRSVAGGSADRAHFYHTEIGSGGRDEYDTSAYISASSFATHLSAMESASSRLSSGSDASDYYSDGSMAVGGGLRSAVSMHSNLRHCDLQLVRAAERGDTNSVKTLLSSAQVSSVDIGVGSMSRTPLHRAAGYGQVSVVEMLLGARAKVGSRDLRNRTPLHEACVGGYVGCLRQLLVADGSAHIDVADGDGLTAAHVAAMHGESACLELVLDYGGDPCAEDGRGRTAAHHAVMGDYGPALKCLIDRGIEVDCPDHNGRAPVHHASKAGAMSCLKMLADSGVDMCSTDVKGIQPCHLAAAHNRLKCLKFLFRSGGAEKEARDNKSRTVLHVAAEHDSLECVHWFLENSATTSSLDAGGCTPLHAAASGGAARSFDCLRRHGANMNLKDFRSNLPVHLARENGCVAEILKAVEGRVTCPLCDVVAEKRRIEDLHRPTPVEKAMSALGDGVFKTSLAYQPRNLAVPNRIAGMQHVHQSKSTSRLSPLKHRRHSANTASDIIGAGTVSPAAFAGVGGARAGRGRSPSLPSRSHGDCGMSRDVAAAMLYGRRGNGL